MIRQICFFGMGLTLYLSIGSSLLTAQTLDGNTLDLSIRATSGGDQGSGFSFLNINGQQLRSGRFTTGDGVNVVAVYSFPLPDLGKVADPFTTAEVQFSYFGFDQNDGVAIPDYNADLYGIDSRSSPFPTNADFFAGPGPDIFATLLQENILTPSTEIGRITFDITEYLNTQYADGANAGQNVFLRFSPDFNPNILVDSRDGYFVGAANNGDAALRPVINFTTPVQPVLLGDVNRDGAVDFDDISPFILLLSEGEFQAEADVDESLEVDFEDIAPFIALLSGS